MSLRHPNKQNLNFFDTEGKGDVAEKGVQKLVTEDGVSLILGPILKTSVFNAASKAQDYEVPMLTLSRTNDPLSAGNYLFYLNLDNESQIDALIRHAINKKDIKRFVALAPDTAVGRMNVQYFQQAVEESGGIFVRSLFYDKGQKDFTKQARLLGGKPPVLLMKQKKNEANCGLYAIFIPDTT